MKTQISRDGYRRDKRYSGVYQQQGRMITDSDWNELVDTLKARVDEALVDIIGAGSPKGRAAAVQMAGTVPKIVPGTVYAGGLEGQVVSATGAGGPFDFTRQADFPSPPDLPASNTAYRIYADVWDRPVGPLEDEGLRDPALHGADTCTRTQTMVQVKWSPVGKNPENPAHNPAQGDAKLTLKYPQGDGTQTINPDACDPKAQDVDPVGGDFLFRVEVHDVRWPAGAAPNAPDRVVVKWSRENGAEQYAFTDMPDWFTTGLWIYELYDADSERHLGFHLATTNWTPKRGSLTKTLPQTAPAGTMVRRWEGYSVLVRSGSTWDVSGAAGEATSDTAGGATVKVESGVLSVSLTDLLFTLELPNKTFLSGDFWSAPVRRSTYQAGRELLKDALPAGVVHRYVTLAEVQTNNQLKARTAQEQRKLAFPRLTELDAADMAYSTTCTSGLFTSAQDTVEKALNRLCAIDGSHVAYAKPANDSIYRGENPATVKQALDLLAAVKADDIGYTTTRDSTIDSVQEALDALFTRRAGSGSRATVGTGGDFGTIGDALNALHATGTVALEMLPGNHVWPIGFDENLLAGDRVSLSGLGTATQVVVKDGLKLIGLNLFEIDRLSLVVDAGQIVVDDCRETLFTDSWIQGQNFFGEDALIEVGTSRADSRLLIRGCILDTLPAFQAPWVDFVLGAIPELVGAYGLGLRDFESLVRSFSQIWPSRSPEVRLNIVETMRTRLADGPGEGPPPPPPAIVGPADAPVPASIPIGSSDWADQNLPANEVTAYKSILKRLEDLNAAGLEKAFLALREVFTTNNGTGTALVLNSGRVSTLLEGNDIRGWIGLYGRPGRNSLDLTTARTRQQRGVYIFGALDALGADVHLKDNLLAGIRAGDTVTNWLEQFNPNETPMVFLDPIRNLVLTDNRIDDLNFELFAKSVSLSSTLFTSPGDLGWIVAENAVYVGNRSDASVTTKINDLAKFASAVATLRLNITRLL
ncbi:MAG: DUF6519 domain-containing protein [Acidobacteriota bacterium]